MIIKTEFDIGDEVYFIANNRICCSKISSITIKVSKINKYDSETYISYKVNEDLNIVKIENTFKTKEELIASL